MARRSIPLPGRVVAIAGAARGIARTTARCLRAGMKVEHTALDALAQGFGVTVAGDAVCGVDLRAGGSDRALDELGGGRRGDRLTRNARGRGDRRYLAR